MAKKKAHQAPLDPRPRRTREHVIADLSVNFVERLFFEAGHSVLRVQADYGYDLIVQTFDEQGYSEEGFVYLQLKATDKIARYQRIDSFGFPAETRHCNLWRREPMPVYFILYDARQRRAFWLHTQPYFAGHFPQQIRKQSLTIHLPKKNVLQQSTIEQMRQTKIEALAQIH